MQTPETSIRGLLCSLEATALSSSSHCSVEPGDVGLLERATADAISPNEELDDFSVFALRCFSVPYYLAMSYDAHSGLENKRRALAYYDAYLDRCLRHGVLEPNVRRLVEACVESGDEDRGDKRMVTNISREQKIEMFKTERQLAKGISALRMGGGANSRGNHNTDGDDGLDDGLDDAELRPMYLMMISHFAIKACNARQLVQQEVDMLEAVSAMPEDARVKMTQERRERSEENQEVMNKLREAVRGLSAGMVNKREAFQAGVFKPSHLLPTMTVEQFGDMEVARMQAEQQEKADALAEEQRRRAQSLNARAEREAEEEATLRKTREFDDFKDAHKRGSGNSKIRNSR